MWLHPQLSVDLVLFTEKILNGKFNFLCSDLITIRLEHGKMAMQYKVWLNLTNSQ